MAAPKDNIDLDKIVDYEAEYKAAVPSLTPDGHGGMVGRCPFHDDTHKSFSVRLDTGFYHCFAEDDGGNFVKFWAKYRGFGDDTKAAYKDILERYNISTERPKPAKKKAGKGGGNNLRPYTLDQYVKEKNLPEDWLREVCRLDTSFDRYHNVEYLETPYYRISGEKAVFRKRFADKEFRWPRNSSDNICLYGEWRIPDYQRNGLKYLIMVEGESDAQSLWFMGIPAVGVPGASMFKPKMVEALHGFSLYLHQEPDDGGQTFVNKICAILRESGFEGDVYKWQCSAIGAKDPSDLYLKHGRDDAARKIQQAIKGAAAIDYKQENIPESIPGAPIHLRQPEGWIYSDKGISRIDEKSYTPVAVCRTPVILTRRLQGIDTGEEKIEVAFKRDGKWQTATFPRSTIFKSQTITTLTDLGCTITSENAKQVVRFLQALEAENIDLIPKVDATSTFGWQPGRRFIPGHDAGIVLDIEPKQRGMAAAYCQNGTFEKWKANMEPHRQRNKFRFILAASFAAPLLRIVKQRIFFVYNWGGSKGGKTAALKAALSAWGDPERLMVSFNATTVGLERTAAFYCDLPLGIDERQLAGNNQGALEKIVYMVSSGKGKIRGDKSGGIQTTYEWRTVAMATGEEPLSTETTQTGVSTRTLEIYGPPFDDEREASMMHQRACMDCGWAGPAFVKKIVDIPEWQICDAYERMQDYVASISDGKNGSHISGIAAVALADAMIDSWFFRDREKDPPPWPGEPGMEYLEPVGIRQDSWRDAKRMAAEILQEQVANNSTDVNENATQFIVDWVISNKAYFGTNAVGTCLGFTSDTGNTVYIFKSLLSQALSKAGYSPKKTMKYLADNGLITASTDKKGKMDYSVVRRFGDRLARFVEFNIGKLAEQRDPIDDDPDETEPEGIPAQTSIGGFVEIDDEDGELPF